jgi:ABC-type multidrug transport system fused ATPase/permease subunit
VDGLVSGGVEESLSAPRALLALYRSFPREYQRRLFVVLGIMAAGALAEVISLGAVVPFLALIANPDIAAEYPRLAAPFRYFGWTDPTDLLLPVTVLFAVAAVSAGAIRILLSWLSAKFVFSLGHALVTEVYRRILHQPYQYHIARNSSEALAAIEKVHRVTQTVLLSLMQSLTAAVIGVCIVGALIAVDPTSSLIAFVGFGAIYYVVGRTTRRRLAANSKVVAATQHQRIQAVQEGIGGIREVLLDGTQGVYRKKFDDLDRAYTGAQVTTTFIGEAPRFVMEAGGIVLIAVLALFMSTRSGGVASGIPALGALALGSQRLLPLMQLVYIAQTRIRANWHILIEVLDLLVLPTDDDASRRRARPLAFERSLRLDSVSFRYRPDTALVLHGVELDIPRGARLGIIGKTGSGKSTIMDLIMGLMDPTEGRIEVDGVPLSTETRPAWQARIAHVPQAIFLADATIAENIAFGVPAEQIDAGRVREAAQQAQLDRFIEELPDDYQTRVGERGVRLSGGQRQRVGIARALYKRADVLVFDEATSALDAETEAAVMQAINGLGRNLTLIIVAHRLSTVAACDQIIRLEDGRIAEAGDFETVVGGQSAGRG